jgi:RNA polymerase sigma factor (sigma-70 family)
MLNHEDDDESLVTRALSGDRAVIEALLSRHANYIAEIAARNIPDDLKSQIEVADIRQDLFLTLLNALRSYDPSRGRPREWLGGVTRTSIAAMIRIFRKKNLPRSSNEPTPGGEEPDDWLAAVALAPSRERPTQEARRKELVTVVESLFARLPGHERDLLVRCEIDDVPLATVAAELGITPGAAAMRLLRIRERCREILGTKSDYL